MSEAVLTPDNVDNFESIDREGLIEMVSAATKSRLRAEEADRDAQAALRLAKASRLKRVSEAVSSGDRVAPELAMLDTRAVDEAAVAADRARKDLDAAAAKCLAIMTRLSKIRAKSNEEQAALRDSARRAMELDGRRRLVEARALECDLQPRTAVALDLASTVVPDPDRGKGMAYAMVSRGSSPIVRLHADKIIDDRCLRAATRWASLSVRRWGPIKGGVARYSDAPSGPRRGDYVPDYQIEDDYDRARAVMTDRQAGVLDRVTRFEETSGAAAGAFFPWKDRARLTAAGDTLIVEALEALREHWHF